MYANYGREEDFAELKKLGVNCTGKIVIMRYGKVGRSTKVSIKIEPPIWMQPRCNSYRTRIHTVIYTSYITSKYMNDHIFKRKLTV